MRYKIVAWHEYQHYKDRCPPWIKLHHSLLTSKIWIMGNDASRTLAIASMLLAARDKANDGSFDGDPEYIKRFAYLNAKPDFKQLIEYGFIEVEQDASNMLAGCNTETEAYKATETETETEREKSPLKTLTDLGVDKQIAKDWLKIRKAKRAPLTETALSDLRIEATKAGITIVEAITICAKKSWQGFNSTWNWKDIQSNGKKIPQQDNFDSKNYGEGITKL